MDGITPRTRANLDRGPLVPWRRPFERDGKTWVRGLASPRTEKRRCRGYLEKLSPAAIAQIDAEPKPGMKRYLAEQKNREQDSLGNASDPATTGCPSSRRKERPSWAPPTDPSQGEARLMPYPDLAKKK